MYKSIKDVCIIVLGWSFVIVGIIGFFLPILQGFLLLLIGLYILSKKSVVAQRVLEELRQRAPLLTKKLELARRKGEIFVSRLEKKFKRKKGR